jgi:hypothetical protein
MLNDRSGKLPSTSRVFQMEFRGRMVFSPLNRLRLSWFHVIKVKTRKITVERNDRFEDYRTSTYEV